MTLHEAIAEVLRSNGHPMETAEIAAEINRRGLYERGDGEPVPASQISARVNNYPRLFTRRAGLIALVDSA